MPHTKTLAMIATLYALAGCGSMGPPGPPGSPGVSPSGQQVCFNSMRFEATTVVSNHYRTEFSDGSVMVSCGVYPSQGNDAQQWSPPFWYQGGTPEAKTGHCFVYHTLSTSDGRGGGFFEFKAAEGTTKGSVTYKHLGGLYDGTTNETSCQPYP